LSPRFFQQLAIPAQPADRLNSNAIYLTPHQSERQMSVKIPRRASFERQDIARNAHSTHHAHPPKPQVSAPFRQAPESPRTPHDASWETGR
jgi:hypothetical protein